MALPVLTGVLPADFDVIVADRVDNARDRLTRTEIGASGWWAKEEVTKKDGIFDRTKKRVDGNCTLFSESISSTQFTPG
ncbi:hypothetical protein EVAR_11385_1 [Eumeta japonica]|uniref:Uncharacterized protein n=1 Tax=Eumeta variegata TaxID=151549 RepID=A0A4C1TLZ1_EUMVA|nr:hypothetical protein EVAR_11385_1 [Eumeta japonica]